MKKALLILTLCTATAVSSFAQGTVVFNTRIPGDVDARVFDVDGVTPLTGPDFSAQLWGGTSFETIAPMGSPVGFRTGAGAGWIAADPAAVAVPGVPGGGTAVIVLRAWNNTTGATWESASLRGESPPLTVSGLGDPSASPPTTPPNLVGLQGFNLVPEPSTIALAVFGALGALLLRRRRQ